MASYLALIDLTGQPRGLPRQFHIPIQQRHIYFFMWQSLRRQREFAGNLHKSLSAGYTAKSRR